MYAHQTAAATAYVTSSVAACFAVGLFAAGFTTAAVGLGTVAAAAFVFLAAVAFVTR